MNPRKNVPVGIVYGMFEHFTQPVFRRWTCMQPRSRVCSAVSMTFRFCRWANFVNGWERKKRLLVKFARA